MNDRFDFGLALVRELAPTILRYPGGNFVSNYDWMDGIGPREGRPTRLDLAWRTTEPNAIGTDEFMRWCRKANTEPMMAGYWRCGSKSVGNVRRACRLTPSWMFGKST